MARRTLPVSEARRLLPQLVDQISREGGRVDVTRHGQPTVTILRTSDVAASDMHRPGKAIAHDVELLVPAEDLVEVIHELRTRTGRPRRLEPTARRTRRRKG